MQNIYDTCTPTPHPSWRRFVVGTGSLEQTDSTLRLVTTDATRQRYSDAQLDDDHSPGRREFGWSPPLRLQVRARFSHPAGQLRGTAGFGFWNVPLTLHARRWPCLPRAVWFFYASPPSNIKLDLETPGAGWKAATLDTLHPAALAWLPTVPLVVPAMNSAPVYRWLWRQIQPAVQVQETLLPGAMTDWHIYTLEWGRQRANFLVDGRPVLLNAPAPRGPLCFVLWLDNQYAVVKPWGRFGWGLLDIPGRQWLEVDWLAIERLDGGEPGDGKDACE